MPSRRRPPGPMTSESVQPNGTGFRFSEGGWVLVVAFLFALAIAAWALAPAVFRMVQRPPGDGTTIESYLFDTSNPTIDLDLVEPAMLHRDMVPVMTDPVILTMDEIVERNSERKTRYLVPSDLVIGVEHNGESRAYPLSVLNVHEVVHDVLGGDPILVSWHWPSASARAMVRHDPGQQFRVSGLVAGGNGLLYIPNDQPPVGGETLYSQMLAAPVAGDTSRPTFVTIPHQFSRWDDWSKRNPRSTAIAPDPGLKKRYKKSSPFTYYEHEQLMFPRLATTGGPSAKTWITLVQHNGQRAAWAWPWLQGNAEGGTVLQSLGDLQIRFEVSRNPDTVRVFDNESNAPLDAVHGLWYSLRSLYGPLGDALSH